MNTKLVKKIGYGYLKLKPSELWCLSVRELLDMYEAFGEALSEDYDTEMQRTSWFTALLMNASGNMRKQIKPEKLYIPLEKRKQKKDKKRYKKEYVENQRERLMKKFNIK